VLLILLFFLSASIGLCQEFHDKFTRRCEGESHCVIRSAFEDQSNNLPIAQVNRTAAWDFW